jgi:hypothetical protein
LLGELQEMTGASEEELKKGLKDPASHPALVEVGLHMRALQFVLSKASVRFEGADEAVPLIAPR